MSVTLDIPEGLSAALEVRPDQLEARLKLELAITLYTQNFLSLGKASEIAGINKLDFNATLADRGIPMNYTADELKNDIEYGLGGQ